VVDAVGYYRVVVAAAVPHEGLRALAHVSVVCERAHLLATVVDDPDRHVLSLRQVEAQRHAVLASVAVRRDPLVEEDALHDRRRALESLRDEEGGARRDDERREHGRGHPRAGCGGHSHLTSWPLRGRKS